MRDGEVGQDDTGELSLYFDTAPGELADLEVAAAAAIQWAQGIKAAAAAIEPNVEYRVNLVAARPGSSNWIAKIERSKPNQALERTKRGWEKVPLILRLGLGLAVAIPLTAKPTYDYWFGNDGFSETQKKELHEIYVAAANDQAVKGHRQSMFKTAQRDRTITAIGTGVPKGEGWKPTAMVPANQFPIGDGLFELQSESPKERTVPQELDVILVTPRLENAQRSWTFRQEGIPGTFNAEMKDKRFLAALDSSAVQERLRADIPMRIRLEIKQKHENGEWKVTRRGRSVVEVISPAVE